MKNNMVKATLAGLLMVSLLATVLAGACAQPAPPAPAPSPTAKPAPSPAPASSPAPAAAPGQVFKFKYQSCFPKGDPVYELSGNQWVRNIEKITNGRVKMEEYGAGELVSATNIHDALTRGALDVAANCWLWNTGTIPEASIFWIPMMYENAGQEAAVYWEVQRPIADKIYREKFNQTIQSILYNAPQIMWTKKPVQKMEDYKGMKVRAPGGITTKFFELLGASVVSMTAPEALTALQSGALDGITYSTGTVIAYKLTETTPNCILPGPQWAHVEIHWNLNVWNSLPPDIQKTIEEYSRYVNYHSGTVKMPQVDADWTTTVEKMGAKFYRLPPAETARFKAKAVESWDWYAQQSADCRRLLEETKKFLEIK